MFDYTFIHHVLKQYFIEVILIALALVITVASFILYKQGQNSPSVLSVHDSPLQRADSQALDTPDLAPPPVSLFIDISGAVHDPGVFEATTGARLADIVQMAGGLSDDADERYVARNFNMAKLVVDQEKIYIPSTTDIANGMFVEEQRILEYLSPRSGEDPPKTNKENTLHISLNEASVEELDTLPGVGPVTAQKILDNRPYESVEELLAKKVVNNATFEKIKDYIAL